MNESRKNNKRAKALWLRSGAIWSSLYGHLTPKSLESVVLSHLEPKDCSPEMMSLLRAVLPIYDLANILPNQLKEAFLDFAGLAWERPTKLQAALMPATDAMLGPEPSIKALKAASHGYANIAGHADHYPQCNKEAFLAFVGEAWEAGHRRYQVRMGQIEGGLPDAYGIVINLACSLALFGERKGLLHPQA